MERLENTGDKETSKDGGDEGWRDWRTLDKKQAGGMRDGGCIAPVV